MKNMMKYILLFVSMVLMAACQDDEWINNKAMGVDLNRPVKTSLTLGVPEVKEVAVTKAGNSHSTILSTGVRIYVFDLEGNFLNTQDIYGDNLTDNNTDGEGHHYTASNVTLYVGTQRVYALANITRSGYFNDPTTLLSRLEAAAQEGGESQFLSTYYTLNSQASDNHTFPQFTGGYMPLSGMGEITVDATTAKTEDRIEMKRLVAQIIFKVNTEYTQDNVTAVFTPQTYAFYNIPKQAYVLEREGRKEHPEDNANNFYHTTPRNFGVISEETKQASFEQFVPESVRKMQKSCEGNYDNRDAFEVPIENNTKKWTHAPLYGMYVVLSGRYSETQKTWSNGGLVDILKKYGDVSYTIHLGDFSEKKYDNYSVERNNIYTYTVTVKGVDQIQVEAETEEGDFQNGAEGDIIELDDASQVFNLDAHYEQVYIDFNLTKVVNLLRSTATEEEGTLSDERLKELIAGNFMLSFRSPFNTAADKVVRPYEYASIDEEGNQMAGIDYQWIEFLSQVEANTISKYPGRNSNQLLSAWEACYKMGQAVEQLYKNQNVNVDGLTVVTDGETGNSYARFTAFINEYFYERDLNGNTVGWKSFANQEDRVMMIASDMEISTDLNSTYATALTYISQASIETFYNTDEDNAMGIETFNENGVLNEFGNIFPVSRYWVGGSWNGDKWVQAHFEYTYADFWMNGRANTICNIANNMGVSEERNVKLPSNLSWEANSENEGRPNIHWDEIGYTSPNAVSGNQPLEGGIMGRYTSAYNACLSRNRDLNGDGKLDDDELRWYLPAISQYLRIGIGSRALSADARLYYGDKNRMEYDYYPGSYLNDGALYWISNYSRYHYWAVEVGAYGSSGANGRAQIRCVRNLPKQSLVPSSGDAPVGDEALAGAIYDEVKTINGGKNYLFDFEDRLVSSIFRPSSQPQQTPYDSHNEDDDENNLPEAFVVAENYIGEWEYNRWESEWERKGDQQFTDLGVVYDNTTDPCNEYDEGDDAVGWRTPNLSELMIMAQAQATHSNMGLLRPGEKTTYCSTQFTKSSVRRGFVYYNNLVTARDPANKQSGSYFNGYIRCVRDATTEERNQATMWNGN